LERRRAEHRVPIRFGEELVQLGGVHPGRERAADETAHARAGRSIDRDAMLFEPADHADVREAAGAAAAERDADLLPVLS